MRINPLGKAILVFLASYVVLVLAFSQVGPLYFKLFQGIFRWEINTFFPPFKVTGFTTETYGGQAMIALEARLTENLVLPDRKVLHTIGHPYTARTIAINQYLHPIIILSVLFAWPGLAWRDRFKVFLLVLPFLLVVEMVDIPILLGVRIMETVQANLFQDPNAGRSLGSYWAAFLHTGGRAALSILAIGLALASFYLLRTRQQQRATAAQSPKAESRRAKTGRNDPCPCGSGKKYKSCCGAK